MDSGRAAYLLSEAQAFTVGAKIGSYKVCGLQGATAHKQIDSVSVVLKFHSR